MERAPDQAPSAGGVSHPDRSAKPLYADKRSSLERLPVDVLKECLKFLPNSTRDLVRFAHASRTTHNLVSQYAQHKFKAADLILRARRALIGPPAERVGSFRGIVDEANDSRLPLPARERHEVAAALLPLFHAIAEGESEEHPENLAAPGTESRKLLDSVIDFVLGARLAADKLAGFCTVAESIEQLPPDALRHVLQDVNARSADNVFDKSPAHALSRMLSAAADISSLPEEQRPEAAGRILAAARSGLRAPGGAERRVLGRYILQHSSPHSGTAGLQTFKGATSLVLDGQEEEAKLHGLAHVLRAYDLPPGRDALPALSHVLDAFWQGTMSERGKAKGIEYIANACSHAPEDVRPIVKGLLDRAQQIADPTLAFDAIIHVLSAAGDAVDAPHAEQAVFRALGLAAASAERHGDLSPFFEVVSLFDKLPADACKAAFGSALEKIWHAAQGDESKMACLDALMRAFDVRADDVGPAILEKMLDRQGELSEPANRLLVLARLLGDASHRIPAQRLAPAMEEALSLLDSDGPGEVEKSEALLDILRPLERVPGDRMGPIFRQALGGVALYSDARAAAGCIKTLAAAATAISDPVVLAQALNTHEIAVRASHGPAEQERSKRLVTRLAGNLLFNAPLLGVRILAARAPDAPPADRERMLSDIIGSLGFIQDRAILAEATATVTGTPEFRDALAARPDMAGHLGTLVSPRVG
ncbi:F-box protein [Noviherbaspirillum aridicola]|uniref:F-box domain-containing protein n=1 Tax=Noviherbaspirillum aridicola TaxID=2849687 RepID=A0ABQ4Q8Z4_9BURK|nr:F-box protein [Noviherbaspirillum aridicola]GIZ53684.1 hypothetical protein NCCP691_36980 [Noviherbaspirillum aridicola]